MSTPYWKKSLSNRIRHHAAAIEELRLFRYSDVMEAASPDTLREIAQEVDELIKVCQEALSKPISDGWHETDVAECHMLDEAVTALSEAKDGKP